MNEVNREPRKERLDAEAFRRHPAWAKRALAYRLLHTIAPPEITRRLQKIFRLALVAPGVDVPPGVDLPAGSVFGSGSTFPPGWEPGQPLPLGGMFPPGWFLPPDFEGFDFSSGLVPGPFSDIPPYNSRTSPFGCSFVWWPNSGATNQAIASVGGYIYQAGRVVGTSKVFKTTYGGGVVDEWPISGDTRGMGTDGTYLYISDRSTGDINKYQLDGTFVEKVVTVPVFPALDITWDGASFWTVCTSGPHLWEWAADWSTNTYHPNISNDVAGLVWDGSNLWLSDMVDNSLYKLDSGLNKIATVAALSGDVNSLAWDGTCIWACDRIADVTARMDVG